MKCAICFEQINKNNIITCPYCNIQSCNNCVKEYLMNYGGLECLNCKKKINITFISKYFTKKWLKDDYMKHYGKICLLTEDNILNDLMDSVNTYNLIYMAKLDNTFKLVHNYHIVNSMLKQLENNDKLFNNCLNNKININEILSIIDKNIYPNSTNFSYGYDENNYFINLCAFLPCIIDKVKSDKIINKKDLIKQLKLKNSISTISIFDLLIIFQENIINHINNNKLAKKLIDFDYLFIKSINNYFYDNDYSFNMILHYFIYNYKILISSNYYDLFTNIKLDINKNINLILNFYNNFKKVNKNIDNSIKKCIKTDCRGFLKEDKTEVSKEEYEKHFNKNVNDKEIDDFNYISKSYIDNINKTSIIKYYKINFFICKLCNSKICCNCNKELLDNHVCNEDDLISVLSIKQGAKNCPGCGIPIFKNDGCDHMFCVNCHCMFNWSNLKITKTTTNPLYYEWMRNRGLTPARNDQEEYNRTMGFCDNSIYNGKQILTLVIKYNITKYDIRYYNLANIFEFLTNYSLHSIDDYNKIRIKYLLNLLNEDEYKTNISKYDIETYYINEYNDIFNTFRFNINDILHNLFNQLKHIIYNDDDDELCNIDENKIKNIISDNSNNIQKFIDQFNNNMKEYKNLTILSRKSYLINNNWFLNENSKKLKNTIIKINKNISDKIKCLFIYNLFDDIFNEIFNNSDIFVDDQIMFENMNKLLNPVISLSSYNNNMLLRFLNIYKTNKKDIDDFILYLKNFLININDYHFNSNIKKCLFYSISSVFYNIYTDIIELNNNKIENKYLEYEKIKLSLEYKCITNEIEQLINILFDILNLLQ